MGSVLALAVYVVLVVRVAIISGRPIGALFPADYVDWLRLNSNFIPFAGYSPGEVFRNFLLTVPFGLLLPLATGWRTRALVLACVCFGLSIEITQLILLSHTVDITDAIFNTAGALAGLALAVRWVPRTRDVVGSEGVERDEPGNAG